MKRKVGYAAVSIVVVVLAAWWWKGRTRAADRPRAAAATATSESRDRGSAARRGVAPARLVGRVTAAHGAPVPGAAVQAWTRGSEPITIAAGADGRFAFEALTPGRYDLAAAAPGFLPEVRRALTLRRGEITEVDLALTAGGTTVRGTVTDASGGPIVGAVISTRARRFADDEVVVGGGLAVSDGAGHYAMALSPGAYEAHARHAEYVPTTADLVVGATEVVLDLVLMPGAAIEGVVMDVATGQPMPGAEVRARREHLGGWTTNWGGWPAHATAGDDGRFRVAGLEPGTHTLTAADQDGEAADAVVVSLGIGEVVSGVELWVTALPAVAGRVVDARGEPVADAEVMAIAMRFDIERSAADGTFRFSGLPRGLVELSAVTERAIPKAPLQIEVKDAPIEGVVLTVVEAPRIVGRIEPPTAATIEVEEVGPPHKRRPYDAGSMRTPDHATAGADGRFELAPIVPERYRLVATTDDGRRATAEVVVPATGTVEVVLQLVDAASVAGRVIDDRGEPVPGTMVLVASAREPGQFPGLILNGVDQDARRAPVGADGRFALGALPAGRHELTVVDERGGLMRWAGAGPARAPRVVELAEGEHKDGLELAVETSAGTLRGVVRNPDGSPCPDAWVVAALTAADRKSIAGTEFGPGAFQAAANGAGGTLPVLSDAAGRFAIAGLRRGTYDVVAEAERGGLRGRVTGVASGSETTVTLVALGAIAGKVTSRGQPLTSFTVDVTPALGEGRRRQRFRDDAGRFRFARVDPGVYQVRVYTATGSARADVTVGPDARELTFDVVGDLATVHGKIFDGAGEPRAGVMVSARAIEPTPASTVVATTDERGSFEYDVAAGSYEVVVDGKPTGKQLTVTDGQSLIIEPIAIAAP